MLQRGTRVRRSPYPREILSSVLSCSDASQSLVSVSPCMWKGVETADLHVCYAAPWLALRVSEKARGSLCSFWLVVVTWQGVSCLTGWDVDRTKLERKSEEKNRLYNGLYYYIVLIMCRSSMSDSLKSIEALRCICLLTASGSMVPVCGELLCMLLLCLHEFPLGSPVSFQEHAELAMLNCPVCVCSCVRACV